MRVIPCPKCSRAAVGPPGEGFPDGAPVVFGRWTGGVGPIIVKCFRCTGSFKVGVMEFNRLPEASADELKAMGLNP